FYRLNVVTVWLPPLRERREDIVLLAEHFAAKHSRGGPVVLSPEAREILSSYDWPGNVRELENSVARALALNPSGMIMPEGRPDSRLQPTFRLFAVGFSPRRASWGWGWLRGQQLADRHQLVALLAQALDDVRQRLPGVLAVAVHVHDHDAARPGPLEHEA